MRYRGSDAIGGLVAIICHKQSEFERANAIYEMNRTLSPKHAEKALADANLKMYNLLQEKNCLTGVLNNLLEEQDDFLYGE